jgi:hypothetical protein
MRTRMEQRPRRRVLRLGVAAVTALVALVWAGNALATHAPPGTKLWGYEAAASNARILQYDIGTNTFDTSCVPPGSQNGRGIAFDPRSGGFLWYTFVTGFVGDGFIHKTSLPPSCANLGQIPFGDGPGGLVPDDIGAMDLDPDNGNLYVAEYISGTLGKDPVSTLFEVNEATGAIIRACNLPTANGFGNDTLAVVKNYPGLPPGKHLVTDNGEFTTTAQLVIPVTSMGAYTPPAGAPACQIVATGNTPGGRTGIDFLEPPLGNDMIATDLANIYNQGVFPWSTTQAVMSAAPSFTLEDITLRAQVGPGPPFRLDLQPDEAINEVGTQHCVTATVTDQSGQPVPGIKVVFDVEGASEVDQNPADEDGTATTNSQGVAKFCYTGPDLPGKDVIRAFADTNNNGVQDAPPPLGNEPFDVADKAWVLPVSTPGCEVKITYGGRITAANTDKATFGGNAKVDADGNESGQEEYQDHGPVQALNFHSINVLTIVCSQSGTHAEIYGQGTVDGGGSFFYRIRVDDLGEPGKGVDRYGILIGNGYDSGDQTLEGGNVQIHK